MELFIIWEISPNPSFSKKGTKAVGDIVFDDIIEGFFKGTLKFLFQVVVEFIFFYTGELVIFVLTFGRRKPRWNYYIDESVSQFVLFTELSTYIGIAFWIVVAWLIHAKFYH